MNYLAIEIRKILRSSLSILLMLGACLLFPVIIKIVTDLFVEEDQVPEGMFVNGLAFAVTSYAHFVLFIPAWILILIGREFKNGHVHRYIFLRSRATYFKSKILFCGIIAILSSCLGILAFTISVETSPFPYLQVDAPGYILLFSQMILIHFLFSLMLMCLIFAIKSTIKTLVIYFTWQFAEQIIFMIIKKKFGFALKWLPLHLINSLLTTSSEPKSDDYFNPLADHAYMVIVPPALIVGFLTFVSYRFFLKADLQPLSD